MRKEFHQAEEDLLNEVRVLAAHVDKAIADAMESLRTHDTDLARAVVEGDNDINAHRYAIEEQTIELIARNAPVASDLRRLVSVLSIVADLERMGDHAEGIARIALFLGPSTIATEEPRLWEMADRVQQMLRSAIESFMEQNEVLARRICNVDDEVDELYDRVHRSLIERLAGLARDVQEFDQVTHVLWASHNLERIGDRATNICERAIYLITGQMQEINVSNY